MRRDDAITVTVPPAETTFGGSQCLTTGHAAVAIEVAPPEHRAQRGTGVHPSAPDFEPPQLHARETSISILVEPCEAPRREPGFPARQLTIAIPVETGEPPLDAALSPRRSSLDELGAGQGPVPVPIEALERRQGSRARLAQRDAAIAIPVFPKFGRAPVVPRSLWRLAGLTRTHSAQGREGGQHACEIPSHTDAYA